MWDFIKYILRLMFEAIFCGYTWYVWQKKIMHPRSSLHYMKLIERMKEFYTTARVLLLLALYKASRCNPFYKPSAKTTVDEITIIGLGLIILTIILAQLLEGQNKRKLSVLLPHEAKRKYPLSP